MDQAATRRTYSDADERLSHLQSDGVPLPRWRSNDRDRVVVALDQRTALRSAECRGEGLGTAHAANSGTEDTFWCRLYMHRAPLVCRNFGLRYLKGLPSLSWTTTIARTKDWVFRGCRRTSSRNGSGCSNPRSLCNRCLPTTLLVPYGYIVSGKPF